MLRNRTPSERSSIVLGMALVVIGGLALAGRLLSIDVFGLGWPLFVLVPGIVLFVGGVAVGGTAGLGLAIPGGVISMVGVVLSFQSVTGLWSTWAYAWALIAPGGVGLGMVLYGLLTGQGSIARGGLPVLLTGLGLFVGFGLFFEGVLHLNGVAFPQAEVVFAAALVIVGLMIVLLGAFGRGDRT